MTQYSRPQAGLFPGDGLDCGAYTANQWRATLIGNNRSGGMIVTGAAAPPGLPATQQFPDVGVYYATPNQLSVSSPAAAQVSIDTGMAIVDGTDFINDTAITAAAVTIPAGAANSRIDRVVVRQNYTGATYTPTYVPSLTVPANTARITVISGVEAIGPGVPTLTQDEDRATYWDIPLYQYEIIHTTGVISAEVDQRDYVDAETKRFFVLAIVGYNVDDTAEIVLTSGYAAGPVIYGSRIVLTDAKDCYGIGRFNFPVDYISGMTSKGVVFSPTGGALKIYCDNQYQAGACLEDYDTHSDSTGILQVDYVDNAYAYNCIQELSISGLDEDDFVQLIFRRDASNVLDTLDEDLWLTGWIVEYFGWGRR